jgi:pimeloyl-ACP methyl ester carboxylesterase
VPHATQTATIHAAQCSRTAPAVAQSNGIELTYGTFGDADAPPIVLIMGLAAQMVAWDDNVCIELAARGRSPRPVPR